MNAEAIDHLLAEFDRLPEEEQREFSEKVLWRLHELSKKRPLSTTGDLRPIGLCKGEFIVTEDFFEPLPGDLLRAFNGETPDPLLDSEHSK